MILEPLSGSWPSNELVSSRAEQSVAESLSDDVNLPVVEPLSITTLNIQPGQRAS